MHIDCTTICMGATSFFASLWEVIYVEQPPQSTSQGSKINISAIMSLNATNSRNSCDWDNLNDLIDAAYKNRLNITNTVKACAGSKDICGFAWGAGNPDLSGIGVRKIPSYIFTNVPIVSNI